MFLYIIRAKAGRDSKSIRSATVPGLPPELAGSSASGHKLELARGARKPLAKMHAGESVTISKELHKPLQIVADHRQAV